MGWLVIFCMWIGLLIVGGAIIESPYMRRRRIQRQHEAAREAWRRKIVGGPAR